jgi:hypothetical protein
VLYRLHVKACWSFEVRLESQNVTSRHESGAYLTTYKSCNRIFKHSIQSSSSDHLVTMPIRPFPIPYSIGTDICHVPRIFKLLFPGYISHTPLVPSILDINDRFLTRIFTLHEKQNFWERHRLSETPNLQRIADHVAGRYKSLP